MNFNYSVTSVALGKDLILIGTYEHGLWSSRDDGNTWSQEIGSGVYGPKINTIESSDDLIVVGTESKTYISRDNGYIWDEIQYLEGKNVNHISISNNILIAGTFTNEGIIYIAR
jgi:photosystem II stability/assembly factor-like uncharacterized protein